jgi:putative PIN family toxin of toxin-antitoxin system
MVRLAPRKQGLALILDTNVVLDLLHFRDPSVAPIMRALRDGSATCYTDDSCSRELARVLLYPQFGLDADAARGIQAEYATLARRCDAMPAAGLPPLPLCRDADDQKFLELARTAAADLLVTKDRALLELARRKHRLCGLRILTPAHAVAEIEKQ